MYQSPVVLLRWAFCFFYLAERISNIYFPFLALAVFGILYFKTYTYEAFVIHAYG
jgi:hypothetical protein